MQCALLSALDTHRPAWISASQGCTDACQRGGQGAWMSEVKDGASAAGHVRDARAVQWVTSALSLCNTGENVLFIVDQRFVMLGEDFPLLAKRIATHPRKGWLHDIVSSMLNSECFADK